MQVRQLRAVQEHTPTKSVCILLLRVLQACIQMSQTCILRMVPMMQTEIQMELMQVHLVGGDSSIASVYFCIWRCTARLISWKSILHYITFLFFITKYKIRNYLESNFRFRIAHENGNNFPRSPRIFYIAQMNNLLRWKFFSDFFVLIETLFINTESVYIFS